VAVQGLRSLRKRGERKRGEVEGRSFTPIKELTPGFMNNSSAEMVGEGGKGK